MQYKVIPFPQSKKINNQLQSIIDEHAVDGWNYINHNYSDYLLPGNAGCFGIGAKPDTVWHVGNVVFQKA